MPKWSEEFSGSFLSAKDLGNATPTVTIETAYKHVFEGKDGKPPESKWILSITGKDKGVVVNKTVAMALRGMFGDNIESCRGQRVQLYTESTPMGMGVRVRAAQQPASGGAWAPEQGAGHPDAPAQAGGDSDIPF